MPKRHGGAAHAARSGGASNVRVPGRGVGFPDRTMVSLAWSFRGGRTSATPIDDNILSLNSAFLPLPGTGQPRYFDQWTAVYNKYRVHKATTRVRMRTRAVATAGLTLALIPTDGTTSVTGQPDEYPRAVLSRVHALGEPAIDVSGTWNMWDILGQTKAQYLSNEDTSAVFSAAPAELINCHIFASSVDGATAVSLEYVVNITMLVEFFDRNTVGSSVSLISRVRELEAELEQERRDVVVVPRDAVVRRV